VSDRYSPADLFQPDMRAFAMPHPFWGVGLGPPPLQQYPWEQGSAYAVDPSPGGLLADLGKPPSGGLFANLGKPTSGSGGLFGGLWPDPEPPTEPFGTLSQSPALDPYLNPSALVFAPPPTSTSSRPSRFPTPFDATAGFSTWEPSTFPIPTAPQSTHPELDPFELAARLQRGSAMPGDGRSESVSAPRSDPNAIQLAGASGTMPLAGKRLGFPAPLVPDGESSQTRRPGIPVPPEIIPGTPEWWEHAKRGHQGLWDFLLRLYRRGTTAPGSGSSDDDSECEEERRTARRICREAFANDWKSDYDVGPYRKPGSGQWTIEDCMRGLISEKCGGNKT
jgi:hypothetical protein